MRFLKIPITSVFLENSHNNAVLFEV